MTKDEIELLGDIIQLEGDCLKANLCKRCPFAKKCLPTFLRRTTRMTKRERAALALNTLVNEAILDETIDEEYFENRL